MKKKSILSASAVAFMLISFLFVSCPSGLEPSWKPEGKATITLDFSTSLQGNKGESRAIVQGDGFLYIRTVGDSPSLIGKFYGPFEVSSGSVFSTTEIPAGTYASLAVIYAV